MRRLALLLALSCTAVGCSRSAEPATDPEDLPRLRTAADEGAGGAPAEATPRERTEPVRVEPPRPQPPAQEVVEGDQRAPDTFTVRLETTKGAVLIDVTRAWAPHGADRFYTLVREGYFQDIAFFRVIEGFMAQAGIHGDPAVSRQWRDRNIPDDPVEQSNTRGMVSYAMAGPGTRTTQFFINLVDNSRLDSMGFAPFGRVRDMSVVDRLHAGYGEGAPRGRGPIQGRIQNEGNTYLRADFPEMDYIRSASIVED